MHSSKRIGVISDTHGLLRPEALDALRGSDLILHAGDIGRPEVIEALRAIAPVRAVRGNNDCAPWANLFPLTDAIEVGAHRIYLLHDIAELDIDPAAGEFDAVVTGHSHKAVGELRERVLYLNPGSAGPRRFRLPVTVARIEITERGLDYEIVTLHV